MTGNLTGASLSTMAASGRTFVPSAHRGVEGDRSQGADRRGSFVRSWLQSIVSKSFSVSTHKIGAVATKVKVVQGEFIRKGSLHLVCSNLIYLGDDNDTLSVDCGVEAGDAPLSSQDPDFSRFIIRLGHSLYSIPRPAGGVGTACVLPAIPVEGKCVLGEFAVKRLAHLALSDLIVVSTGDDNQRIDDDVNASDALLFAGGPDVSCLIIGLGHLGPPVSLLI